MAGLISCLSLLLFFTANAQESDFVSIPFTEVLEEGNEIPGLSFIYNAELPRGIDGTAYGLVFKRSDGVWASDTLGFYNEVKALQDTIFNKLQVKGEIKKLLFEDEISDEGVQEYLDNLIRNELIVLNASGSADNADVGELIILGNKVPFKPYYKLKIQILSDIRMLFLIGFLVFFVFAAILLVVAIFIIKTQKKNRDILVKRFTSLSYEPLNNLLFEKSLDEIKQMDQRELTNTFPKKLIQKSLFKDVLIQEIISLNKNMKGDFKVKLKLIYRKLDLDKHTIQKLSSKRWDIVTTGIVEINEMDILEAEPLVSKFINHKNFYLRSNAVATLLNISDDADLKVLANQEYPLSKWQQMIYYRIIRYSKDKRNIAYLLESKNESVRVFGIKLIRYLGLVDQLEFLVGVYPDASDTEKIEIIQCFDMFGFGIGLEQIYADLKSENKQLVLAAIKLIQNVGDKFSLTTLIELSRISEDFDITKAAMKGVMILDKTVFDEVYQDSQKELEIKISKHLKDPVLNHV
ncbi:hypothetical protein A33Q_1708 [Indibacter alkaliphilus LW1]|uniref:HEAT repeat-containing protein n=1 Tax=Indibacter alkaliphilus (strain CCUG 57479 / KCTC 22604 / LW1) TaxID=1189612 RepID=S2DKI1_INDAL|nr:hypothetical protein [Indibacter alkaliphilus]EOZ97735.1 hypothetical protein A33Q_1708 [Indibacter alkaliphilus LW1]